MKRYFSVGLMVLAFVAASLFTAKPASAAVVTCSPAFTSPTTFPKGNWTQFCTGTTPAQGQAMATTVDTAPGAAAPGGVRQEIRRAPNRNFNDDNGVRYFLFANPTDYADSAVSLGLGTPLQIETTPGSGEFRKKDFGATKFNSQGVPVYSVIFVTNGAGVTATTTRIKNATGHEVGNAADGLMGYIKNGGIIPPTLFRVSNTTTGGTWKTIFQDELNVDWGIFNTQPACGTGSVYTGKQDENGVYICNGTNGTGSSLAGVYVGLSNQAVLQTAWPKAYGTVAGVPGVFAEEYAKAYGGNDTVDSPKTADFYLDQAFAGRKNLACSAWFTQFISTHDFLPVAGDPGVNMPSGCVDPSTLMITHCVRIWSGNVVNQGHFPDGNVLSCNQLDPNTPDTTVTGVLGKLESLGRNGAPVSYTPIKKLLTIAQSNMYYFGSDTQFHTFFQAAGEPEAGINLNTAIAVTYPRAPLYNTVFNLTDPTVSGDVGKTAYVASHELGHVVDLSTGQPSQSPLASSSPFDLAMQHDWLDFDFRSWTSPTVNTRRGPCELKTLGAPKDGPFVGLVDPTTGLQFCNGAGGLGSGEGKWASSLNSDILRQTLRAPGITSAVEVRYLPTMQIGPTGAQTTVNAGWYEYFPQAFAVQAQSDMGSTSIAPILDNVVKTANKLYFPCTASVTSGWLHFVYLQQSGTPTCTSGMPAGWVLYRP